ncbi:MAG: ketosteroid isomerase [Acidimicrobiales bacterium]|nr:ketosteroid isomerase [Acidimicrobiales bacterium]
MDRFPSHPARDMAVRSMGAVEAGDRESWLELYADDAVVEDPIGPSPFDPDGKGHRGKAALAAFWDNVISQAPVRFAIRESYAAGNECANVGTVTIHLADGSRAVVEGVYTYRIDDGGRVASLRAFWEQDQMRIEPQSPA